MPPNVPLDPNAAVIAGLAATTVLTLLMYAAPPLGFPKMDMIGLMGTMFTPKDGVAYLLGGVVHFVVGILLAFVYVGLWSVGLGSPTWGWGMLYGFAHGLLSLAALPMMLRIHPRSPRISPTVGLLLGVIGGHMGYGMVVALVYAAFVG